MNNVDIIGLVPDPVRRVILQHTTWDGLFNLSRVCSAYRRWARAALQDLPLTPTASDRVLRDVARDLYCNPKIDPVFFADNFPTPQWKIPPLTASCLIRHGREDQGAGFAISNHGATVQTPDETARPKDSRLPINFGDYRFDFQALSVWPHLDPEVLIPIPGPRVPGTSIKSSCLAALRDHLIAIGASRQRNDCQATVFDLSADRTRCTIQLCSPTTSTSLNSLVFIGSDRLFLSITDWGTLDAWETSQNYNVLCNAQHGQQLWSHVSDKGQGIIRRATADDTWIVGEGAKGCAEVIRAEDGLFHRLLPTDRVGRISQLCFQQQHLVVAYERGIIQFWNPEIGALSQTIEPKFVEEGGKLGALAFSGPRMAVAASQNTKIEVWNVVKGTIEGSVSAADKVGQVTFNGQDLFCQSGHILERIQPLAPVPPPPPPPPERSSRLLQFGVSAALIGVAIWGWRRSRGAVPSITRA